MFIFLGFLYLCGLMSFLLSWSFLSMLISLELINMVMFIMFIMMNNQGIMLDIMLFLVFLVCEAIVGLVMMILSVKVSGKSMFYSTNFK